MLHTKIEFWGVSFLPSTIVRAPHYFFAANHISQPVPQIAAGSSMSTLLLLWPQNRMWWLHPMQYSVPMLLLCHFRCASVQWRSSMRSDGCGVDLVPQVWLHGSLERDYESLEETEWWVINYLWDIHKVEVFSIRFYPEIGIVAKFL